MKIALVNPPDKNRIFSEIPRKISLPSGALPPLGLLYLEGALSRYSRHQVEIIDSAAMGMNHTEVLEKLRRFSPRILGMTGHTQNLVDMVFLSRSFREENPDGIIIWGGAHATAFPRQSARFPWVDLVVSGEGERVFVKLMEVVDHHGMDMEFLSKIDGLTLKNASGNIIQTSSAKPVMDLDSIPIPRRQLLKLDSYYQSAGEGGILSAMSTSRGCPFKCRFCSTPGPPFRARSPQKVADEMETCLRLGIDEVYIVDDTFNLDGARVIEICREIVRREIKIRWNYRGRVDLVDQEQLQWAKKAGCRRVQLGVETGTDEGMEVLGKGITTGKVRQVFKWIRQAGLESMAYFMIGCPHEKTPEDIEKTLMFAMELSPDYALFGILTPYPGTAIYEQAVEEGIIDPALWDVFVSRPDPDFVPPIWASYFTPAQLEQILGDIYRKFYQRPGYIMGEVLKIRSPRQLWNKIKTATGIFFS